MDLKKKKKKRPLKGWGGGGGWVCIMVLQSIGPAGL